MQEGKSPAGCQAGPDWSPNLAKKAKSSWARIFSQNVDAKDPLEKPFYQKNLTLHAHDCSAQPSCSGLAQALFQAKLGGTAGWEEA